MGDAQFRTLLDALPQIEESVSKFESEAVQQQVIEGLLTALMGAPRSADDQPDNDEATPEPSIPTPVETALDASAPSGEEKAKRNGKATGTAKKGSKNTSIPATKGLDFFPSGKNSLPDFYKTKNPSTHPDRSLVMLYWLTEEVDADTASAGDIYAGYKACGIPMPANQINNIDQMRSKGHVVGGRDALKLTSTGENRVRHQLNA